MLPLHTIWMKKMGEQLHSLGKGALCSCTSTGSTTVITLTTAAFSAYQLYVNRVVDIGLTASPYTLETSGSSRTITAVSATAVPV